MKRTRIAPMDFRRCFGITGIMAQLFFLPGILSIRHISGTGDGHGPAGMPLASRQPKTMV